MYLRVVGPLHLLLVEADLVLLLGSHLGQGVGQLVLKCPLLPVVDLRHATLVPSLGLTQLLQTHTGWWRLSVARAFTVSFVVLPLSHDWSNLDLC